MKTPFYPSIEEIRALEMAAQHARSDELLRLFKAAANAAQKLLSPQAWKGVRHA